MARNVIFLDIDGVLNNENCFKVTPDVFMDRACVAFLHDTISEIEDCRIVISSSWRNNDIDKFFEFVRRMNCEKIFEPLKNFLHEDCATKRLYKGKRGYDIKEWLSRHPEVEKYICLDDDSDYLRGQPLLQINRTYGFGQAERCILQDYFNVQTSVVNYTAYLNNYSRKILTRQKNFIKKYIPS